MADYFTLIVTHKGQKRHLTAKLLPNEYSYTFQVTVDEIKLFFEPDEEGQYRLIRMPWQKEKDILIIDKEMLEEIIVGLKNIAL